MAEWNGVTIQELPSKTLSLTDRLVVTDTNGKSGKALVSELTAFVAAGPPGPVAYVDGTNGDDVRTGATDDTNTVTGRVRSLARVGVLHSRRTNTLTIYIVNTLEITQNVLIECQNVNIVITSGGTLRFKKFTNEGYGEATRRLMLLSANVSIYIQAGGTLDVEGHSGTTGVGDQFFYRNGQGALAIVSQLAESISPTDFQSVSVRNSGTLTIGDNAVFCVAGRNGTNRYGSIRARYWRGFGASPILGTNAVESDLIGDRTFLRSYHPISSTDAGVLEGETVISPTNKKLWTKQGGTIRDALGTTFA